MTICIAGKNAIAINGVRSVWEAVQAGGHRLVALLNATDDGENGWQPSFKFFCAQNGIPIVAQADLYGIEDLLLLSLEYDKLIRTGRYKSKRLFNIHFSLLPAYKGMYTSAWPILRGERQTGVTLHHIDDGIDTGDIVDARVIAIPDDMNGEELYRAYLATGSQVVARNIPALLAETVVAKPQPLTRSSYFSKSSIDYKALSIDLCRTGWEVHNQIRAFAFRPYQLPLVEGHRIYRSAILPQRAMQPPGTVLHEDDQCLEVATIDYSVRLYKDRQPELIAAAEVGNMEALQAILETGFPADVTANRGWNAAIVAAYHGQTDVVKLLLNLGQSLNCCNYRGTTLLMYAMTHASQSGEMELMNYLLSQGADVYTQDDRGRDLISYAREYGNADVVRVLDDFIRAHPAKPSMEGTGLRTLMRYERQ